jgi:hypothetical protein
MKSYRFTNPPRALRKSKLDNIALVPASLLPFRQQYQEIANELPEGAVLICLPPSEKPQRLVLERVAANLRAEGYRVTTLPVARVTNS